MSNEVLFTNRAIPIEADDARREAIENDHSISPEHLTTVADLERLLNSDAEKDRVYPSGLDPEQRAALNDFLDCALMELREEQATVAGIVDVLSTRMLDICSLLRKKRGPDKVIALDDGDEQ